MHNRRLVKRSVLGSRVYASSPTGDGAPVTGVVQAVKQESAEDAGARRGGNTSSVYTVLLPDGSLKEFTEDEITSAGLNHTKGPLKSSLKSSVNGGQHGHKVDGPEATEGDRHETNGKRMDAYRSVSLLEQKRKVVSSSIDVPHARWKGASFNCNRSPVKRKWQTTRRRDAGSDNPNQATEDTEGEDRPTTSTRFPGKGQKKTVVSREGTENDATEIEVTKQGKRPWTDQERTAGEQYLPSSLH